MRKFSEIKGEDALDVLADILEPISEIVADKKFVNLLTGNKKAQAAACALKHHKKEVLTILAVLDGTPVEEYAPSVLEIPALILKLLNDPDLIKVFQLADPEKFSGSATGNTEETGKK